MHRILTFAFALFTSVTCAQSIFTKADDYLLNAQYEAVVKLADDESSVLTTDEQLIMYNKKAEALIRLGKIEEAEKHLMKIQPKANLYLQGVTQTNYGLLYIYQGKYDLALDILQKAIKNLEVSGKNNSLESAQAITYLGQVYKFTGKSSQAEEQLRMALSIRQRILTEDHELIAASYNDLGLAYVEIDNDLALDYYEKALKIYQMRHGDQHSKIALTNSNMGLVYRKMKLYGDAVNDFETALKVWEKIYPGPNPNKAFTLHNLGQTYAQMGDEVAAKGFYTRALAMYRESYGAKHPDIAQVLNDYGNLELSAGKFELAINQFQEAVCANVSDFNEKNPIKNPKLQNYYNGQVLLFSLLLKARAFESIHFGKSLKLSDLKFSLNILQRCDTLIDKLRQQSTNESDKIALGGIASEVYADGVRTAQEAAAVALQKKKFRELCFYFAEKSKSAVLIESITESNAKSFAGIPQNLLEEEKDLKNSIALTAQKLAQKPATEEEKYLREKLFALNRSYELFVKGLEENYPSYFNLKYNASSPTIADVQSLLDKNSVLLSYFIDEINQRIYNFVITQANFKIIEHALPEDFDKNLTGLRNGIYFSAPGPYAKASNALSKILLPKLPRHLTEVIIVPTGRLGIIPFETLATKKIKDPESFENVSFLMKERAVRYEFSAGLLLQKQKKSTSTTSAIFLCAPVTFPDKENLSVLPGTASEVNSISELFASKNILSKVVLRKDATENAIKSATLKDYKFIHFATHGLVDENSPELSRIFLEDSESEDGHLFSGEIYNLEMDADLVTLSACQTGLGKISKGEGVIGLSRALVYAGARSIVVSFWSVADESTSELMKSFYQNLLNNPSAGYANNLRQAKLALMADSKYSAPFYWAPFILIGF